MMDNKNLTVEKKPVMFRVARTKRETPDHVTLFFNGNIQFRPGQFVMLWIPGLAENLIPSPTMGRKLLGSPWKPRDVFQKKQLS